MQHCPIRGVLSPRSSPPQPKTRSMSTAASFHRTKHCHGGADGDHQRPALTRSGDRSRCRDVTQLGAAAPELGHADYVTELTTKRLELRRWREEDLDEYAALIAHPDVIRYVGGPTDRASAWRQMAIFIGHRELRGWTNSAVVERSSGRLLGRGGLWQPEGWPGIEVGWILHPSAWGQGYATELGLAVRDHAFGRLGIRHLISLIHPDNAASIRVAEKIGSALEGEHTLSGTPHLIYGQFAQ
jgi:RimJ/RimL family protein N-acetyltransferase